MRRPEYRPKDIRSYVIRQGRVTEGQKAAFDEHWPRYGLSLEDGELNPVNVFGTEAPLVVEIGFGMGDSLISMCQAEPEKHFLGIEVHPPGVGRIMNRAHLEGVGNLRVYMADAIDVLRECFAEQSIDRLQIYFPDPWHKAKHHKRRLISPAFLELIAPRLKHSALVHIATDWHNYAEEVLQLMSDSALFENLDLGQGYSARPSWRPLLNLNKEGKNWVMVSGI